jgi:rhodanese-related sulfurtransferase
VAGRAAWFPGAAPAAVQGRIAAANVCGGNEEYPGTLGTVIVKLFDGTVGRTGLTTAQAAEAGFDPVAVTVPGLDHAHFIPDAQYVVVRLVADRRTRRLLGAQAFGTRGVDKRLDVLATAIAAGLDVDALSHLNLAYAPAYSLALDPVLAAANVLRNKLEGRFSGISAIELRDALNGPQAPLLLDVRLPSEFDVTRLEGSRHIPLGVLRSRAGELPRDRPIVLVCKLGLRSYEASLILQTAGLENVRVLEGGLEAWPFDQERLD